MMVRFVRFDQQGETLCQLDMTSVPRGGEAVDLPWSTESKEMHRFHVHHVRWEPLAEDRDVTVVLVR